ncbi:hypothetical protein CKO44_16150 [Rubrivivax gelatinosus]|uniref:hypothetical protein n=1 Tax=Rubrivivax gelatinosus TaxID=28068 RepID=UPI00190609D7|nr:hypothetical protein [Rubrivivax gelatinosus]MBK1615002.1 hypothetical protein [Rubrivivax gelatinosus]MBZ8143017.1 hypothetical protein [Rubrivivax gelatinosus]
MWPYIAAIVIAALVATALTPRPATPKPSTLDDFDMPVAELGIAIPVVFGTVTITGANVVWYGNLRTKAIKSKGGKK